MHWPYYILMHWPYILMHCNISVISFVILVSTEDPSSGSCSCILEKGFVTAECFDVSIR